MEEKGLGKLEVYKIARKLSSAAWEIYKKLPKQLQYSTGNQFLSAIDSIGANIAEGFGRYSYKDSIRFYYIARGSLTESSHWISLLTERKLMSQSESENIITLLKEEGIKLNNFINSIKKLIQSVSESDVDYN